MPGTSRAARPVRENQHKCRVSHSHEPQTGAAHSPSSRVRSPRFREGCARSRHMSETEPRLPCLCSEGTWGPHSQCFEWGQWSASLQPGGCRVTSLPSLIPPSSGGDRHCSAASSPLDLQPREAGPGLGAGARRGQWAGGGGSHPALCFLRPLGHS